MGYTLDRPDELVSVAFAGSSLESLPEVLEDATIERLDATHFRIRGNGGEWEFAAASCHVHRDVSARFYAAIPPRIVPWSKRLFWRLMLAVAANPLGVRLLRAMRR